MRAQLCRVSAWWLRLPKPPIRCTTARVSSRRLACTSAPASASCRPPRSTSRACPGMHVGMNRYRKSICMRCAPRSQHALIPPPSPSHPPTLPPMPSTSGSPANKTAYGRRSVDKGWSYRGHTVDFREQAPLPMPSAVLRRDPCQAHAMSHRCVASLRHIAASHRCVTSLRRMRQPTSTVYPNRAPLHAPTVHPIDHGVQTPPPPTNRWARSSSTTPWCV
jgi:hypothetical protein